MILSCCCDYNNSYYRIFIKTELESEDLLTVHKLKCQRALIICAMSIQSSFNYIQAPSISILIIINNLYYSMFHTLLTNCY